MPLPPGPHTVESLLRVIEARDAELVLVKLMNEKLRLQLARRIRDQYGASSERFDDGQRTLIEAPPLPPELPPLLKVAPAPAANAPALDRSLPTHLPREELVHRAPATHAHHDSAAQACGCSACGGPLRRIGADVSEQPEYVPARFKVIRHVRPKLACVKCQTIFQAEAPSRPIVRGIAGPAFMAHVRPRSIATTSPLYRQSRINARSGVHIDRSTLARWVGQGEKLLDPLLAALGRYVLAAGKLHADDTPVPVLSPGKGKTKEGRLWVYVRDDRPAASENAPAAWFRYSPDREGRHPRKHLEKYRGILQADGYGGWLRLCQQGQVIEAACGAHYPERRFMWGSGRIERFWHWAKARYFTRKLVYLYAGCPASAMARLYSSHSSISVTPGRLSSW